MSQENPLKEFIAQITGTFLTTSELHTLFKEIQASGKDDLIAFWHTLQFAIETDHDRYDDNEKKNIAVLEEITVKNMRKLAAKDPDMKEEFLILIRERDAKRNPSSISNMLGSLISFSPSFDFNTPLEKVLMS